MKFVGRIAAVFAAIALAVTFVGAGFLACIAPPVTHGLASVFSDDQTSPFKKSQLVEVADATRSYSFGSHDAAELYRAIYQVNQQYSQSLSDSGGSVPSGFPLVGYVNDTNDASQLRSAFVGASEMYCYSAETISHLDDCYNLAQLAYRALIAVAAVAVVALAFTGVIGRKHMVGGALVGAGTVVLLAFVALGVWALIDFNGLFTMFHKLFFSQGNWTFPYDSLLICALPEAFWAGMGAVWLVVSAFVSILSILIGFKVRK